MATRRAITAPADLDEVALQKWNELAPGITATQTHLLANLCRNHSNLIAIRRAKAAAVKSGAFEAMVTAKNGALVASPYIRAETRLLALENRMLLALRVGDEEFF